MRALQNHGTYVADVVADLVDILVHDPSADVRHKTVAVLARFADRDERVIEAIARAAEDDADPAIRHVARHVAQSGQLHVRGRKAALRAARRELARRGVKRLRPL